MEKLARLSNVLGRLKLITSEHPDFNSCILQRLDGVRHIILEPILDGCSSNENDSSFKVAVDLLQKFLSVHEILLGFGHIVQELVKLGLTYNSHAHEKSPQTLLGGSRKKPLNSRLHITRILIHIKPF